MNDKSIFREIFVNIMGGLIGGVVLIFIGFYAYRWLEARSQLTPTPTVATLALAPTPTPKPLMGTPVPLTPTPTGTPTPPPMLDPSESLIFGWEAGATSSYPGEQYAPDKANNGDLGNYWVANDWASQTWWAEGGPVTLNQGIWLVLHQASLGRVRGVVIIHHAGGEAIFPFEGDYADKDVAWVPTGQLVGATRVEVTQLENTTSWPGLFEVVVPKPLMGTPVPLTPTPIGTPTPPPSNLLEDASCEASSTYLNYGCEKAIDGKTDKESRWVGTSNHESVTFTLGQVAQVNVGILIRPFLWPDVPGDFTVFVDGGEVGVGHSEESKKDAFVSYRGPMTELKVVGSTGDSWTAIIELWAW